MELVIHSMSRSSIEDPLPQRQTALPELQVALPGSAGTNEPAANEAANERVSQSADGLLPVLASENPPVTGPVSQPADAQQVEQKEQVDLVICPHYSFENRWGINVELVDYATVERWNPLRLQMDNSTLRRLKIYRLAREPKIALLKSLESCNRLRRLEMDRLELAFGQMVTTFTLRNLGFLYIDSIIVVDVDDEQEVPGARAIARFNSVILRVLRLGPNCLEHLEFSNAFSIQSLDFGPEPSTAFVHLENMPNLNSLEWNQLEEFHFPEILQFALGIKGKVKQLRCNLDRFDSPTSRVDPKRVRILRNLYHLFEMEGVNSDFIDIYFNGILLDLRELRFEDYRFDDGPPIRWHHHNVTVNDRPTLYSRTVVRVDYGQLLGEQFDPQPDSEMRKPLGAVGGRPLDLAAFMTMYPCIRIVDLDNSSGSLQEIDEQAFVRFLEQCRGLTQLRINCCQFSSELYIDLASLPSLAKLDHLSVYEENSYQETISDHLLVHLNYLRHLQTNLATRAIMMQQIEKMQIESELLFVFWSPSASSCYHYCLVEKSEETGEDQWLVLIERGALDEEASPETLYYGRFTLAELEHYFDRDENAHITAHWLDVSYDLDEVD